MPVQQSILNTDDDYPEYWVMDNPVAPPNTLTHETTSDGHILNCICNTICIFLILILLLLILSSPYILYIIAYVCALVDGHDHDQ